jgi:hypothetical protein
VRVCDMRQTLSFGDQTRDVRKLGEHSYVGSLDHLTRRHYQQVLAAAYSLRSRPPNAKERTAVDLPAYSASEIRDLFCPWIPEKELRDYLSSFGLSGGDPWQLLLPAQQMRAFAGEPGVI